SPRRVGEAAEVERPVQLLAGCPIGRPVLDVIGPEQVNEELLEGVAARLCVSGDLLGQLEEPRRQCAELVPA
ncbi:hypothetical protein DF186_18760, partial [Enterococcus hirae]